MANLILRRAGALLVVVGLLSGCALGDQAKPAGLLRPAETSVPKGTGDPRVQAAVAAYEKFTEAVARAQQKPVPKQEDYPERADFRRFSFDPVEGEYEARLKALSDANGQYRGTPPTSNLQVKSIDPDARPWPTITLSDCQTGLEQWRAVEARTGRPLSVQEPTVPRPYAITITVIYNQLTWGVNTISMDRTRTCPD